MYEAKRCLTFLMLAWREIVNMQGDGHLWCNNKPADNSFDEIRGQLIIWALLFFLTSQEDISEHNGA